MISTTKPITLHQLQDEMLAGAIDVGRGLSMVDKSRIFRNVVGSSGPEGDSTVPSEFADEAAAQAIVDAHVALRNKTSAEYATEFQDPGTAPSRKQELRDIQTGLLPPEQVPITQEEWDAGGTLP